MEIPAACCRACGGEIRVAEAPSGEFVFLEVDSEPRYLLTVQASLWGLKDLPTPFPMAHPARVYRDHRCVASRPRGFTEREGAAREMTPAR